MLIAKNSKNKTVNILDSIENEEYYCPICHEKLERKFGLVKQYFSHPIGKGNNCELKIKLMLKNNPMEFQDSDLDILNNEYYNKEFSDVNIEMSDYLSEEGYYLTQEQKNIIFAPEDRIKISALAGSSKSTTLYYYSKERPYKKILYLVYNKSMKEEAEKMYSKLHNVTIKTTHGLGYQYVGKYYHHKLTFGYNAVDTLKDLGLNWNEQEIAVKTYNMFKEYLLSNVEHFSDLQMYEDDNNKNYIISLCERLWELKKDYKSNVKMEHDMYLKMFQLSHTDLSNIYDSILLDEAQDSNMIVYDIIKSSNVQNVVIVGDIFQQLYGWRRAINIIPLFEGKEYKLTTSFRVSQHIANISNIIISDVSDNVINMKGFNSKQKIVQDIDRDKLYVCLCRTNSSLFGETVDALEHGKKALYYVGGYNGYNFNNILDCYYFSKGHKVKNPLFNKFKDYYQMEDFADTSEDIELLSLIRMIEKYNEKIPELINKIKSCTVKNKEKADVIFSTIHKSKGCTFPMQVLISDDHFDIENVFNKKFIEKDQNYFMDKDFFEEMCILYVAITRSAGKIQLSDNLKHYLLLRFKYFKNKQSK